MKNTEKLFYFSIREINDKIVRSSFLDLAYCHHILAINRLNLANIILDPSYIQPPEPRRLAERKINRGRPR